jgi:hypothetical protein
MPLPENETAPKITATQVILHSAVGSNSLYNYFGRSNVVVESHFWVSLDGRVEQYMDTARQADANYKANCRAISIESADNGDPDDFPWTDAQLEAISRIVAWAHVTHGIPIQPCAEWDSPGVDYHSKYPGIWTPVKGKTCPGTDRIEQVPGLRARAKEILVAFTEAEIRSIWKTDGLVDYSEDPNNTEVAPSTALARLVTKTYSTKRDTAALVTEVAALKADMAALKAQIAALQTTGITPEQVTAIGDALIERMLDLRLVK